MCFCGGGGGGSRAEIPSLNDGGFLSFCSHISRTSFSASFSIKFSCRFCSLKFTPTVFHLLDERIYNVWFGLVCFSSKLAGH